MDFMKILRIILLVIGVLILLLSLLADAFGLGISVGFGNRQILGTIFGIILTVIAILMLRKKPKK